MLYYSDAVLTEQRFSLKEVFYQKLDQFPQVVVQQLDLIRQQLNDLGFGHLWYLKHLKHLKGL